MTTPDLPAGRPVPDTDDLRLLAEIINNGAIGLPQAAWNARMSQTEAAARFVTMAERGMPLRLVAEGDRQLLWRIAQAGPATNGFQLPDPSGAPAAPVGPPSGSVPAAPPVPPPAFPPPAPAVPAVLEAPIGGPLPDQAPPAAYPPPPVAMESQPVQQLQVGLPPMPPGPPTNGLPPASAVPPHEQAIAGAVPLGQPPFGTPPAEPAASDPAPADTPPPPEPPVVAAIPAPEPAAESPAAPDPEVVPAPDEPAQPASATPDDVAGPAGVTPPDSSTWGVPGSSTWVRSDDPTPSPSEPAAPSPELTQSYPPPSRLSDEEPELSRPSVPGSPVVTPLPPLFPPSVLADFSPPQPPDTQSRHAVAAPVDLAPQPEPPAPQALPAETPSAPASSPTRRTMISGLPTQSVAGLFGEHLTVSLQQIIDPADQILSQAGYRMEPGERALMVQTTVGNQGQIDYESLPDLYLMLLSSTGAILQKAAMSVAQFPAHRVGVPAGALASGWTVFLVPADTEVTEVRWSVRPDLANRTVVWGFGPA